MALSWRAAVAMLVAATVQGVAGFLQQPLRVSPGPLLAQQNSARHSAVDLPHSRLSRSPTVLLLLLSASAAMHGQYPNMRVMVKMQRGGGDDMTRKAFIGFVICALVYEYAVSTRDRFMMLKKMEADGIIGADVQTNPTREVTRDTKLDSQMLTTSDLEAGVYTSSPVEEILETPYNSAE